jgi:hypothetical protein
MGVRDTDGDHIYDPLDNPAADRFFVIGEESPLAPGDWVEVYGVRDAGGNPFDRLDRRFLASNRWLDRGRIMWDGYLHNDWPIPCVEFEWEKNGDGQRYPISLQSDLAAPEITQLEVRESPRTELVLRFIDADTHGGWVRATSEDVHTGERSLIIKDEFYRQTTDPGETITAPFDYDPATMRIVVRVWAVGNGPETVGVIEAPLSGAPEGAVPASRLALSPSRPNPSGGWVAWNLEDQLEGRVVLRVFSADGRCVRSWSETFVPSGGAQVMWDGMDELGRRVPAGRYFLRVSDGTGRTVARTATIVR